MADRIIVHYKHTIVYLNTPVNAVGDTTSTTLRTIPTPGGDIAYVRKFGTTHTIKDITNIADPTDPQLTIIVKSVDGVTTYGSRTGGGAYVDGSTTVSLTACKIEAVAAGGVGTLPAALVITDVDFGALSVKFPTTNIPAGETVTFYISAGGSSYYDSGYRHGGARHTPALNSTRYSYFDLTTAKGACANANDDGVEVLDSATYDEELDLNLSQFSIYSTNGQAATITRGVGARVTREVSTVHNNVNAVFFNENGNDGTAVSAISWQKPYKTIVAAIAAIAGRAYIVYGGDGATMNGGIFDEIININAAFTLESEYGYLPEIQGFGNNIVIIGHINGNIDGFIFNSVSNVPITVNLANYIGIIQNCICSNSLYGILANAGTFNGTIQNCICSNNNIIGIYVKGGTGNIEKNICYNNNYGITIYDNTGAYTLHVFNNICYNNLITGISVNNGDVYQGVCENNICYKNNNYGLEIDTSLGVPAFMFKNIISWNNGTWDLYSPAAPNALILFSNYGTKWGWAIGGGCITTDPEFCKITSPYKFGISANSGAYRTDFANDDMGAHLRIIGINASNIEINGFNIDGQSQYNNGIFILDTANHTGAIIKWNDIFDFQGIAIDPYDDNTNTDCIIKNNKIYNNGNGVKLSYGGNTVEENCIYNNSVFGIWLNRTAQIFNHNVFCRNQYGIYIESNASGISIKNCIFSQNLAAEALYSKAAIILTYCCITDGYNINVNITDSSNKIEDPNFINITIGSEDFNIKTKEIGYNFDSVCKNSADDGYDIGAYKLNRAVDDDSWRMYQLENDPTTMDRKNIAIDQDKARYALGSLSLFAKSHKKILPLIWTDDEYSTEDQYDELEYMSTMIKTLENNNNREKTKIRALLLPDTHYETGVNATIDATNKTITLASKNWKPNKYKGWWADIIFESDTGNGDITAATKKLKVTPSPAWTDDEWIGYVFYHNYRYYYILDNDADELTLSDPDGTLNNENNIDWQIQQSFRITENSKTVLTVLDPDSLLIDGTYNFVIDFMECVIQDSVFGGTQLRGYDFENKEEMTGYAVILEES